MRPMPVVVLGAAMLIGGCSASPSEPAATPWRSWTGADPAQTTNCLVNVPSPSSDQPSVQFDGAGPDRVVATRPATVADLPAYYAAGRNGGQPANVNALAPTQPVTLCVIAQGNGITYLEMALPDRAGWDQIDVWGGQSSSG